MDPEEQRREREPELDPGAHQAVPQVQAAHREESGLHAHDLQPVQVPASCHTLQALTAPSEQPLPCLVIREAHQA